MLIMFLLKFRFQFNWSRAGPGIMHILQAPRSAAGPLTMFLNNKGIPAAAKSLQLCPTLCEPIDVSPPGSPIPGILQARTLEWVAISFSSA